MIIFMSLSNFRFLLSNRSQILKIDAMVTFLWLIKRVYFSLPQPVHHLFGSKSQFLVLTRTLKRLGFPTKYSDTISSNNNSSGFHRVHFQSQFSHV